MTRLLLLVCVLLLVAVAAEVVRRPGSEISRPHRAVATVPSAGQTKRPEPGSAAIDQLMAVVLARPLFAPDRRPVAGAVAGDPAVPRLTGIIASPDGSIAIFQPEGAGKSVVARGGESVSGWEVTTIANDAVYLRKANQVIALSPRFAGAAHAGAVTAEAKQSKSRWEAPAATGLLRTRWSNPQLQP